MRVLLAAACLLTAFTGCAQAPTRIVVVVGSDLEIPRDIEELRIEIDAIAIGGDVRVRTATLDAPTALPIVLVVHHDGGSLGPIIIRAIARKNGVDVVSREATLSFSAGRSVVLRLDLMRACLGVTCAGATCAAGECISPGIDVATLPEWSGRDDGGTPMITDDAGPLPESDAGADGGVDGGVDGGPSCASGCACEQTCGRDGTCDCVEGCDCALSCVAGTECSTPRCDGPGTICTVDGAGTSTFDLVCDHMASCTVDVRGATNATGMECKHGATCDIDCTDVASCHLKCDAESPCLLRCGGGDCDLECGDVQVCADGIQVCNRDCP